MMLKDVSPSECRVQPPDGHLALTACRDPSPSHPLPLCCCNCYKGVFANKGNQRKISPGIYTTACGKYHGKKRVTSSLFAKGFADEVVGHYPWQITLKQLSPSVCSLLLCPLSAAAGNQGRLLHGRSLKVIISNFPSKLKLWLLRPFHDELALLLRLSLLEVFSFCERNRA